MQMSEVFQQLQSPTKLHTLSGLRLEHTNFTRPKPLLLLAYLCIEGKKDKRFLAELFWTGASNHLNSLAKALSQLRQVGVIDNDETHAWATIPCDVNDFFDALEQHDLGAVITLYQDSFLSGFYLPDWGAELEEWIYTTREFLAARMREVWLELAEASGDAQEAARYAERAYEQDATLEPDVIQRLYKLLSNTPHAVKLKQEAREFGLELLEKPAQQSKALISNLPNRGTSFIGRDIERLELAELIAQKDARLITIVGQGGVGKTRLAIEVAREIQEDFPDGVVYLPLEALTTPEQVLAGLASAFSVQLAKDGCVEQVAKVIADKQVLLLLDNTEHLLEQGNKATILLRDCPHLKILVTSRMRLNLEEEWVYALEGFSVPDRNVWLEQAEHHEAVALFVQRARKVKPGFTLTNEHLPFVLDICERVQGLPLGIELAASWIKVMSCQEIAEHLEEVDFLSTPLSNVPERHQSLRHVFEGSWQLLSQEEQTVLSKLSVFRGGFTREAARNVAGATLIMLARLVDKSLLRVSNHRYEQHPLLRSFAQEKVQDTQETQTHHAMFFLTLAEAAEPHLRGSEQLKWFKVLNPELDNIRASLAWFVMKDKVELALRLSSSLQYFWCWWHSLIGEGRGWLDKLLPRYQEKTEIRAKALFATGAMAWLQGDNTAARSLLEESLTMSQSLENPLNIAKTSSHLALVMAEEGHYDVAKTHHEESLRLFRELADRQGVAGALHNLGILARRQGDMATAQGLYEESLQLYRQLGYQLGTANLLNSLALVAWEQNDLLRTHTIAEEALHRHRELNNNRGISISLHLLALVASAKNDVSLAFKFFHESLMLRQQNGDRSAVISSLEGLASLLKKDDPERAVCLWSATESFRKRVGVTRAALPQKRYTLELVQTKAKLAEESFAAAWAKGSLLELEQAITLAFGESSNQPS
jgi:predicted ATPase